MRVGGRTISVLVSSVCLALGVPASGEAAPQIVPPSTGEVVGPHSDSGPPAAGTVQAVVVKSWGGCDSQDLPWKTLNATWADFGSVPIHIDYRNQVLCRATGTFTLKDLEASRADVVILSDTDGHQFTVEEVDALRQYAEAGHDLIGSFYTFAYEGIDNGAVAQLFGLVPNGWQVGDRTDETFELRSLKHGRIAKTLFRGLPDPYLSSGYPLSQTPEDGTWSRNDLDGAKIVATNADATAAITVFERLAYHATYVSTMPEYQGSTDDIQFVYNAIIFPRQG